ncbi:MAG: hypothetical protein HY22_09940 [[Candidatus Thermochlorobacteriaceae] bacterium GBChlB]|jgi:hypothetical protein|nr:MAG: hypothetical protein HY22_09940 [[Candidatus Thermochlorobacteriaceae] bacterium GBChlB]
MNEQQVQINIELDDKTAEGIYSNFVLINHSPAEFVIDFTKILPGVQKARISARIIMTPQHAKSLLIALQDNIEKYETSFGTIKIVGEPIQEPMGFRVDSKNRPS